MLYKTQHMLFSGNDAGPISTTVVQSCTSVIRSHDRKRLVKEIDSKESLLDTVHVVALLQR